MDRIREHDVDNLRMFQQTTTLPKEPVLKVDDSRPASVTPGKATDSGPQPVKSAGAGPAQQTGGSSSPAAQQTKNAVSTEAQIISTQAESGSQGFAEKDNGANETDYVTVQIGVFLDEKDASHLLKAMERKGYAPTFFSGQDAEARQWYSVRIGAYSDKQQAANAAANFSKQEKIKAWCDR